MARSDLSASAKAICHALGLKMDASGGNCHPTINDLTDLSGLSRKTVIKHLAIIEDAGWISITKGGFYGQMHNRQSYVARFPDRSAMAAPRYDDDADFLGAGSPDDSQRGAKAVELGEEYGVIEGTKTVYQLHHDKDSPKDSPNISPQMRTRTGVSGAERRKSEKLFVRWLKGWPNAEHFSLGRTRKAWDDLDADQRLQCQKRTADYLASVSADERIACPAAYLTARAWEQLPVAEVPDLPERIPAKAFGKLWMAYRFWLLLQPATGQLVITGFDQRRIDQGFVTREALLFEKRRNGGWPPVNDLVAKARDKAANPALCPSWLVPVSEAFRQVQRGTDLFAAWQRLHARRGWPWFQWTTDYPWFPPVDRSAVDLDAAVDAAMTEFEMLANGRASDAG